MCQSEDYEVVEKLEYGEEYMINLCHIRCLKRVLDILIVIDIEGVKLVVFISANLISPFFIP